MQNASTEERKIILFILCLLSGAILFGIIKRYLPQTASQIIYLNAENPDKNSQMYSQIEKDTEGHTEVVFINSATRGELSKLSGIGGVIAQRIIDHRQRHGLFKTKEDLVKVKGIGPKKLEKMYNYIRIK